MKTKDVRRRVMRSLDRGRYKESLRVIPRASGNKTVRRLTINLTWDWSRVRCDLSGLCKLTRLLGVEDVTVTADAELVRNSSCVQGFSPEVTLSVCAVNPDPGVYEALRPFFGKNINLPPA